MAVPLLNARLDAAALAGAVNGSTLPPAIVCNAHITGLAVSRALARRGVPVIALDREPFGVGLVSNSVAAAGICHDPISQLDEFIADIQAIGDHLEQPAVLFGCMDEWVLALSARRPELERQFRFPFASDDVVRGILDKSVLYAAAEERGIPYPRTIDTRAASDDEAIARVGLPAILKPAAKRPFYDAFGANLFVVPDEPAFREQRERGAAFGMLAQEIIPTTSDDYVTVAVAIGPDGSLLGSFTGQRLEISPAGYGTTCLARAVELPDLEQRAATILRDLSYYGIAEVEFLRDPRDGEFKLLDINTRPWKWIGLPIASGVDLPWLVYAATTGQPTGTTERRSDIVWVSIKDYVPLRARGETMQAIDQIGKERWLRLIAGQVGGDIVDAIFDPADPEPMYRALQTVFGEGRYSCPC